MTPSFSSLRLNRLAVLKSGGSLYDQTFHSGVNIIRGENSSGKSTISDFIFFALGGELTDWTPEASSADSVHAEVNLSGKLYTISRDVDTSGRIPMYFFEGNMNDAMANRDQWRKYPAVRSSNSDSFSQVLFRLLRLPEQKTEGQQNITMHQLLRLLYMDQMTPVDEIFRHERFDTRDIRIAISELLLGLDDLELHDIRLRIRDLDRKYGELVGELRSIFGVLGKTADSDVAILDFQQELKEFEQERASLSKTIEDLSTKRDEKTRRTVDARLSESVTKLRELNTNLGELQQRIQALSLDIEDSQDFIRTLKERIEALDASRGMGELLGNVSFTICPECMSPIENGHSSDACALCKSKLPEAGRFAGHLKMREELAFQARESQQLLEAKIGEHAKLVEEARSMELRRKTMSDNISQFTRRFDPVDAEVANLLKRQGYIDKSVEDLSRKAELAALVKGKMAQRDSLSGELERLRSRLDDSEMSRKQRRSEVDYKIVELCVEALHADLPMEEVFKEAELVQFDFGRNKLAVNGRTRFSASSATYLKNAFLFSLFELSLYDLQVRWPRFILLDNIEDKGMQPKRSANFQEYVVSRSLKAKTEHQIIMTTSMISAGLENTAMCIGPHYTEREKSLRFQHAK